MCAAVLFLVWCHPVRFSYLVQSGAGTLCQPCIFYSAGRRMLGDACRITLTPAETERLCVFLYQSNKCQNQTSFMAESVILMTRLRQTSCIVKFFIIYGFLCFIFHVSRCCRANNERLREMRCFI
ncbi:hypothetical protein XENOCAPTIV_029412 [Xenoophorus captivus]|uniref:Secreted protein n=1 Tax=Xenoophorus captivus TaxID=1517983 RepID=A0ABV0R6Z3_9TELE